MATPEQNTLLALQLFGAPAEQFNAQNNAKTALALRLAEGLRAEQVRKQIADEQNQRFIEQANIQGATSRAIAKEASDRAEAAAVAAEGRQNKQLTAMQIREDSKAAAAEEKQLHATIAAAYPKYAAEATRLGEKVQPLTAFADTWEGLGTLQAEMSRLEQTRINRDQEAASTAAVGELDDAAAAVATHKKALEDAMKPHPEDVKFAQSRATSAVQTSLETGDISGAPKPNSTAAKKGLTALARGDSAEAATLLGSDAMAAYDSAYQAAMMAAPNFKGRMQELTIAQQNYQTAQRNLATIQSDLRKAAATSLPLATKLTERRTGLQNLMTPDFGTGAGTPRTFEQITPPPASPGARTTPSVIPTTPAAIEQPGVLNRGLSALMDIGGSMADQVPGFSTTSRALGTAADATGNALQLAGGRIGAFSDQIIHPADSLVQMLEAEAARRRALIDLQQPDQTLIGAGPN